MPWHGEQFDYTPLTVRLVIETFNERREQMPRRPCSIKAAEMYDLLRAIDAARLTPEQGRLVALRMLGFSWREIGYITGKPKSTIYRHGIEPERRVLEYMRGEYERRHSA